MAEIKSVKCLLEMNLTIPPYQRSYKWTYRNISDLLSDIDAAINDSRKYSDFKYRVGTVILNKKNENRDVKYYIVDGQQRIISLILLNLFLDNHFKDTSIKFTLLKHNFEGDKISQTNIHNNYRLIEDWFSLKLDDDKYMNDFKKVFNEILEVVVICVNKESEAFQLFDSQNTRGRPLDPHDLLKAYHLREMKDYPYEMQYAVKKWEAVKTKKIKELFELYLFPIRQWTNCVKSFTFSANDIDVYKGIPEDSSYTYARRASKATPHYQITEAFITGNDFFEMTEHYLQLLKDVETEIDTNNKLLDIKEILENEVKNSKGFLYAKNLFFCALLCFYDRFRNLDVQAIKKLFSWAFMLRVDMSNLGFNSINKYAIGGEDEKRYSNKIAMFSKIRNARLHTEISNMQLEISRENDCAYKEEWNNLYYMLKTLNGLEVRKGRKK